MNVGLNYRVGWTFSGYLISWEGEGGRRGGGVIN